MEKININHFALHSILLNSQKNSHLHIGNISNKFPYLLLTICSFVVEFSLKENKVSEEIKQFISLLYISCQTCMLFSLYLFP